MTIPLHEFLRAVIYGDAVHYDAERSPVTNLFDLSTLDSREHFVLPITIGLLASGTGTDEGFVETGRVYELLQGLRFTPDQIDWAIVRGHRKKLIETSARRIPELGQTMPRAMRATTVGVYHVAKLSRLFSYIDAIAVDTPILDVATRAQIRDVEYILGRLDRADVFRRYLNDQWRGCPEGAVFFDWNGISAELQESFEAIRVKARMRRSGSGP